MRLISVSAMKQLEQKANDSGYTYADMMRTAGGGIANYIERRYKKTGIHFALGLVGKGNNGGDTVIALTELQKYGWITSILLVGERDKKDELLSGYAASGGIFVEIKDLADILEKSEGRGIILDGVYGTGFHPPLPKNVVEIFTHVRDSLPEFDWVAVDCPSGVDCENGIVSDGTVKASISLSLEAVKLGMLDARTFPYCGKLVVVDLGLSKYDSALDLTPDIVVDDQFCLESLPERPDFSHKGTYGKTIVIGGSANYPGAPVLAGKAAYAVGTGLVQIAIPESIGHITTTGSLELTWLLLEDAGGVISELAEGTVNDHIDGAQSLVVGPGMGREISTQKFISRLLMKGTQNHSAQAGFVGIESGESKDTASKQLPPLVIDADALFHLSREENWEKKVSAQMVLTPHPGEMATLTGLSVEEIQSDRINVAREYAKKWGQVVVLKGALTVVANPDGRVAIVPIASSALAKAGTGDVLTGMIGGLLAQSVEPWHAAAIGAYLHAQAGLRAREMIGSSESVLAGDLIRAIPQVYQKMKTSDLP